MSALGALAAGVLLLAPSPGGAGGGGGQGGEVSALSDSPSSSAALAEGGGAASPDSAGFLEDLEMEEVLELLPEEEARALALLESFEEMAEEARAGGLEEVVLVEAHEIAAIAEEILVEGDTATARDLLEEAIALLGSPGAE